MKNIKKNWFEIWYYFIFIANIILIFFSLDHLIFRFSLFNLIVSILMSIVFLVPKEKRFKKI